MTTPILQSFGGFSFGKKTQNAGTVITRAVWPYPGRVGQGVGGRPLGIPHVTSLQYTIGTTAHVLTVMRPFNYTTFSADAAAAQAVVNLTANPGTYSGSGYQYGLPNGMTAPRVADNGIAASDYVVYAAADGTWVLDTVSSVSSLAVTLATNLPTGGVKSGGLLYFFGITTDSDPATGEAHQQMDLAAAGSGTAVNSYSDAHGLFCAWHPGDPLVFHSSNGTTAGTFELLCGYYAKN